MILRTVEQKKKLKVKLWELKNKSLIKFNWKQSSMLSPTLDGRNLSVALMYKIQNRNVRFVNIVESMSLLLHKYQNKNRFWTSVLEMTWCGSSSSSRRRVREYTKNKDWKHYMAANVLREYRTWDGLADDRQLGDGFLQSSAERWECNETWRSDGLNVNSGLIGRLFSLGENVF